MELTTILEVLLCNRQSDVNEQVTACLRAGEFAEAQLICAHFEAISAIVADPAGLKERVLRCIEHTLVQEPYSTGLSGSARFEDAKGRYVIARTIYRRVVEEEPFYDIVHDYLESEDYAAVALLTREAKCLGDEGTLDRNLYRDAIHKLFRRLLKIEGVSS